MVLGVVTSDGDVKPPFILPHDLRFNMETYMVPEGGCTQLVQEVSCWKTLYLATGFCTIPHKQENSMLSVRKFLCPHHSPDYKPFDYYT